MSFKIDTVPEIVHSLVLEGYDENEVKRQIREFHEEFGRMPYNASDLKRLLEGEVE